jgi:hypothetical protein
MAHAHGVVQGKFDDRVSLRSSIAADCLASQERELTPQPYYAQSLISAILESYKMNQYPYQDLIIYELGAGNGSFMLDSLRYLRKHHPEVFARTTYRIIEISAQLAKRQRIRAKKAGLEDHVEIVESDFFKWGGGGPEPCYVVALEVLVSVRMGRRKAFIQVGELTVGQLRARHDPV